MPPMEPSDLTTKLGRDAKRDADHKHKWKLGDWSTVAGGKQRPWHVPHKQLDKLPPNQRAGRPSDVLSGGHHVRKTTPIVLDNEVLGVAHDASLAPYSSSNSSAESVPHGSRAPEPDAGIAYSFDAARGPSDGSDVLSHAMTKAVARFEDKKTTKLVKDEYDVVKAEDDDDAATEMEDDFELVGKIEL